MGKVIKNIDENDESNPFEEFDKDDVVNKSELKPFGFEDKFSKSDVANKNEKENEQEKWISEADLRDFVKYGKESKQAADLYKSLVVEPFESSVIKKADAAKKHIITAADIEEILNYDEDSRKSDHFSDEYKAEKSAEEEDEETEYLIKNFKDFIIAPKITGAKVGPKHKNLIPQDYYDDKGMTVEIADDPSTIAEEHRTQIEINRTKQGEIESILVTCKCGEKTFIQFDYIEEEQNSSTEYVSTIPDVEELDMMPRKKSNIDIPERVIQAVIDAAQEYEDNSTRPNDDD